MGFLTSFFSGAFEQANKGFDNAAKEQERINQATTQRQLAVDAEAAKQNAQAKKVADLARSLQATGMEPDKAFAIARYPKALEMTADQLADLGNRMQALPGQMTPAERQTRTVISPAASIPSPGIFVPPVKQPAVTMTTGENQPPRQMYSITGAPASDILSTLKQMPEAQTPEQKQAQIAVFDAVRSGKFSSLPNETFQLAMTGSGQKADKVYDDITTKLANGYFRNADEAKRAYVQQGGTNPNADFSMVVPGVAAKHDDTNNIERVAQTIYQASIDRGKPISMADARLMAVKQIHTGINQVTGEPVLVDTPGMVFGRNPGATPPSGSTNGTLPAPPPGTMPQNTPAPPPLPQSAPGTSPTTPPATPISTPSVQTPRGPDGEIISTGDPILDNAPSKARMNAVKVPKMDQINSETTVRNNIMPVGLLQNGINMINKDHYSVGLTGQIKELSGFAVEAGRAFSWLFNTDVDYGKPIDKITGASEVTAVRGYFKLIEANIARPMLQDRQVSEGERNMVKDIVGALDTHHTLESTSKSLQQLLDFEYVITARHLLSTVRYAPPDNLSDPNNKAAINAYVSQIMGLGYSQQDAQQIVIRLARHQKGWPLSFLGAN